MTDVPGLDWSDRRIMEWLQTERGYTYARAKAYTRKWRERDNDYRRRSGNGR